MKHRVRLRKISNYTLQRINELYNEAHNLPLDYQQSSAKDVLLWAEEKGFYTRVPIDKEADDDLRKAINDLTKDDDNCPHCIALGIALAARLIAGNKFTADKLLETASGIKFEITEDQE